MPSARSKEPRHQDYELEGDDEHESESTSESSDDDAGSSFEGFSNYDSEDDDDAGSSFEGFSDNSSEDDDDATDDSAIPTDEEIATRVAALPITKEDNAFFDFIKDDDEEEDVEMQSSGRPKKQKPVLLKETEFFRLKSLHPAPAPLSPTETQLRLSNLTEDLRYIVRYLCDFASKVSDEEFQYHSWAFGARQFFISVGALGEGKFVESVMERMTHEAKMLVGNRQFDVDDVARLPLVDLQRGGIYVNAVTGISTDNPFFKSTKGLYGGSAYVFGIRWRCYFRHRTGSLNSEATRMHMQAVRSGNTVLNPRAVMVLEDNELGTPFFSIAEGIMMILFGTVHDYGTRNSIVTDESIQLFCAATPPTFPPRDFQRLNTAFSFKQGIGGPRNGRICCVNCGLPRHESYKKRMVFARIGGRPFTSYWCIRCYDFWRSSGKVRPGIVIRRNSTPKPDACSTCRLPAAQVQLRGWSWDDVNRKWNCVKCYYKKRGQPIGSRKKASIPKPDRCPRCRRKPAKTNRIVFSQQHSTWWCRQCSNKYRIPGERATMRKTPKPGRCPACQQTKTKRGGKIRWRWDFKNQRWFCTRCSAAQEMAILHGPNYKQTNRKYFEGRESGRVRKTKKTTSRKTTSGQTSVAPIFTITRQKTREAAEKKASEAAEKNASAKAEDSEYETTFTFSVPKKPVTTIPQRKRNQKASHQPQPEGAKRQTTLSFTTKASQPEQHEEKRKEKSASKDTSTQLTLSFDNSLTAPAAAKPAVKKTKTQPAAKKRSSGIQTTLQLSKRQKLA